MKTALQTKEEIFTQVRAIMVKLFELDENDVTLDANLYEELDLDSIDAIDMVVKVQELTGKKIHADDFKSVRQVQDVVNAIHDLIHN